MHDEFERIDWLKARFELDGVPAGAMIGIGDDASVLDIEGGRTVLTVDAQIQGVHFRRGLLSPGDLGWRALIAAASDILAMGARPVAALSALTLPNDYRDEDFEALVDGLAIAAETSGAHIVGGNLSRAESLTLTTTVLGVPIGQPVSRSGASPGDTLYVTGTLGSSALGFRLLDSGVERNEGAEAFVMRWRRPPWRGELVDTVSRVASACIDVSDGCLQDLGHLCASSNVGAELEASALPHDPGFETACGELGANPIELALTGGEDYELLFTAPRSDEADAAATAIGTITSGERARVLGLDGRPLALETAGFRHFS